ncbi:MAG: MarR family winged helix-turn-helix transcriptional regulator, partial [Thermoleophilia bacterium]
APVVTAPVVTAPVVTAPPAGWPAEVAELLPAALDAVRPLVAVSDHVGVTPRMLVVMSALSERPLSVGEQAALLGVSRPVVADVAARLESLGLTRREKDPADRRRVRIALTPKGHRLVADAAGTPSPERIAVALAGLDDAGRAALLTALRALAGGASSR